MTENDKHIIRVAMRAAEIESRVTQDDVEHIDEVLACLQVTPSSLEDDARECLMDVVSHWSDFVLALRTVAHAEESVGNANDGAYWRKQITVINRMKEQAERAIAASAPKEST